MRIIKEVHCTLVMAEIAAGIVVKEAVAAAAEAVVAAVTKPTSYSGNPALSPLR
jgi:hypothetical protein